MYKVSDWSSKRLKEKFIQRDENNMMSEVYDCLKEI